MSHQQQPRAGQSGGEQSADVAWWDGEGKHQADQKWKQEAHTPEEYVEWRRNILFDDVTGGPATKRTFYWLMTKLNLWTDANFADMKDQGERVEFLLRRTAYKGTLTFYPYKQSEITIGQSNSALKAEVWRLIAPHTAECTERPTKRRKTTPVESKGGSKGNKMPSPSELMSEIAR